MDPILNRTDAARRSKRIAKSIKRRQTYVENLRRSAAERRGQETAIGRMVAEVLDDVTENELVALRSEKEEAKALAEYGQSTQTYLGTYQTPAEAEAMREKHREIMTRIGGRLSSDRIEHLARHLEVGGDIASIEMALGLEKNGLLYGDRIKAAEKAAFGAVRFE